MTMDKDNSTHKQCSRCKIVQEISNFTHCKRIKSGISHRCKNCDKDYYLKNREQHLEQSREYAKNHPEEIKQQKRKCYLKHKEKYLAQQKIRRQEHKEEDRIWHRNYRKNRLKTDINYKLARTLRCRIKDIFRDQPKSGSAVRDLGCTIDELKIYLESLFQPDMNWSNHSLKGWHIDHIIPLSSFDLTDRTQFLKACHYTNLQPLWAIDNLRKKDKIL